MRRVEGRITGGWFTILPVGWVGEWHESPEPQWVIPLSGRWFIQTRDGKRVEMRPGDIILIGLIAAAVAAGCISSSEAAPMKSETDYIVVGAGAADQPPSPRYLN